MSFKTISLSLIAMLFIVFVFISIISDDVQIVEKEDTREKKNREKEETMKEKREAPNDVAQDEIHFGGKRFKLYEKKHLNYKKATIFCKKKNGKLAEVNVMMNSMDPMHSHWDEYNYNSPETMNLDEMRRLQMLLMKAKTVSDDMWVGADKKEWKKHSLKMQRKPNFGPDPALFGGGPTEMCPALSVSTRSLLPVACTKELAFICEFDPTKAKSTKSPQQTQSKTAKQKKPESKSGGGNNANKPKTKRSKKVEMRRRKRQVESSSLDDPLTSPSPPTNLNNNNNNNNNDNEDDDDDNDSSMETTEKYITENSVSAVSEHNIGFAPHVEHLLVDGEGEEEVNSVRRSTSETYNNDNEAMEKLVTVQSEKMDIVHHPPTVIHQEVKVSTKIIVEVEDNNILKKSTTTQDPDQMLMDMNDEQTMNLTAIELEAAAEAASLSHSSLSPPTSTHTHQQSLLHSTESSSFNQLDSEKSQKIGEYMDDNEISSSLVSDSSRIVTTDEPGESSKLKSSFVMNVTLSMTSGGLEDITGELQEENVTTNDILSENDNSTDTTTASEVSGSTFPPPGSNYTAAAPMIDIIVSKEDDDVEGDKNKRPIRNATHSIVPVIQSSSSTKVEATTFLVVDDEEQQQQSINGIEIHSLSPKDTDESVMMTTTESSGNTNETSYETTTSSVHNIASSQLPTRQESLLTHLSPFINDTEDFERSNPNNYNNFSATESIAKEHSSITLGSYPTTTESSSSKETTNQVFDVTANSTIV